MIGLDELDCLDYLIWLRTGDRVAKRLNMDQASVSRKARRAVAAFGLDVKKSSGEWDVEGDLSLLNMERQVHQDCRWKRDLPLRIDAQYYSGPLLLKQPPQGWLCGAFDFLDVATPLSLLRRGVVDVWIAGYPDVPDDDDDDFAVVHLDRLPTHLVVSPGHPLTRLGDAITLEDVHQFPALALPDGAFPKCQAALEGLGLWNSASAVRRYSYDAWEGRTDDEVTVAYASAFSIGLYPTEKVILPIEIPLTVGDSLVVPRRFAEHPRFLALVAHLRQRLVEMAPAYPELEILPA